MAPTEVHELAPLASLSEAQPDFEGNYTSRIPKDLPDANNSDEEGSDDENGHEDAGVALLSGHTRSNSGPPNPVAGPTGAVQVKGIISETAPTLFLTVLGMMFTGELLQRVTHWRPMRTIDELFILIPMLNNLKGNLELVLSARLATAAHIGVLDRRASRRVLVGGSLSLLQLQALSVSAMAAAVSFILGLALPDPDISLEDPNDTTGTSDGESRRQIGSRKVIHALIRRAAHKTQKVKELDSTKSGWREFIVVLATAMSSACLSGLILGSFMCSTVLFCRRYKLDPDNIAPPLASCLGDLVTLTLTALTSTLYFYTSGRSQTPPPAIQPQSTTTPIGSRFFRNSDNVQAATSTSFPLLPSLVAILLLLSIPFVLKLCSQLTFSRPLIRDGWTPLFGAMAIESGTGLVLDWFVGRYHGFGLLAVVITGLPGSVGSVFVSRLGTELHQRENSKLSDQPPSNPKLVSLALFVVCLPVLLSYLLFVWSAGWLPLPFGFVVLFIAMFSITVAAALLLAYYLTHRFWRWELDPDAYCLPVHSALVDLVGQLLLVACYEMAAALGNDVKIRR